MPQKVNIPGVGPVNFPDGMPAEQITLEVQKILAQVGSPQAQAPAMAPQPVPSMQAGDPRDSFVGGVMRGLRDIPDAGAQMVTRGLASLTPKLFMDQSGGLTESGRIASDFANRQVQQVEDINRQAETDYQQNWRKGGMAGQMDLGRVTGQTVGSMIPAIKAAQIGNLAATPIRAAGTAGMVSGGLQPVTVPSQRNMTNEEFAARKVEQAGVGAGAGMAGGYLFDKLGRAVLGARVPPAAQVPQGAATANASGGGSTLGRVGPDPSAGLTEAQRAILQRGQELGFRSTPGQSTGSTSLQQMEARMESNPFFSGPFNALKDTNQKALNRAAAEAIGEQADELSSPVLARAADRIGRVFDSVGDDAVRQFDPNMAIDRLTQVLVKAEDVTTRPATENALIQKAIQIAERGTANGAELAALTSKLGKVARKEMTSAMGDRDLGDALFAVKELVDDLLMQGMDDAARAGFAQARAQYRSLVALESRGVVNPSSGNVSGLNLASTLSSKDKTGFVRGRNQTPMYDAARFAQAFRPIVGNSGTATRMMDVSPLSMALSLPSNLAAGAYTSGPSAALARAVTGKGLAGGVLTDAQRKLLQQLLPIGGGVAGQKILGQ